ncbi:DNA polymerase-3 subunit epsilon [Formivibrio citricus]|uniref:DNA-directed DNA polymerase n=1 Tax=Formivibrio citricus TaxID=83765 RepID=A0A1I4WV66_9NEIS|nr:exonuclease domain-containing protein [Formivibrio citricus]SFN17066.1 DNA polymerase-3 subunit epsilon [Formivibrio citricus]
MSALANEPLAFVDLETTGANPLRDRITEIGLVLVQDGRVESWSSLVNPGVPIPPFIQNLTGIDDAMVADAPAFADLAQTVLAKLEGRLFIAHNARFDYGFLKSEFQRLGIHFRARVLCTVQLSKKLYPLEHKHNLDMLVSRHGLVIEGERHRALTDAELLRQFMQVAERAQGPEAIDAAVAELTRLPAWPEGLDTALMDELPETPGVFVCYGEHGAPLFVGSAGNVRKEVLAHFAGKRKQRRELPLVKFTQRLEWFETSGDFGSALLEKKLLRELAPQYNPPVPEMREPCCWRWDVASGQLELISLAEGVPADRDLFGPFRSRREATNALTRQVEAQGLCKRVLGLEAPRPDSPACLGLAAGKCKGACIGRESLSSHQARLLAGLSRLRMPAWPYPGPIGIAEGPDWAPVLHVFEHWNYLGSLHDASELPELLLATRPPFDPEMMKLLRSEMKKAATKVVKLR